MYKSGQYEEAKEYAEEALRLGTLDAALLFHTGMIDYRLGESESARAYLEQAVEINPGFSVLYAQTAIDTLRELESSAG
ncbi:MAG: tetratricopeptide repeat protein [Chloroflexi bacterium]|nr:tetratricopeptide repeat protein [Chloroflexota bacterium]